jgi:hypothetical protein
VELNPHEARLVLARVRHRVGAQNEQRRFRELDDLVAEGELAFAVAGDLTPCCRSPVSPLGIDRPYARGSANPCCTAAVDTAELASGCSRDNTADNMYPVRHVR